MSPLFILNVRTVILGAKMTRFSPCARDFGDVFGGAGAEDVAGGGAGAGADGVAIGDSMSRGGVASDNGALGARSHAIAARENAREITIMMIIMAIAMISIMAFSSRAGAL